ncbi:MAG: hypothetical protein ABL971_15985 [Vicinamibacterales bacterium]
MRLGCDIDGVLADLETALLQEAQRLFPASEPATGADTSTGAEAGSPLLEVEGDPVPVVKLPSLTSRQQEMLWREVRRIPNFWETLGEIESGAIARLASLARAHRWEVVFLTSRPSTAGDLVQLQTQRWLERLGYTLPSAFVVKGSRGKIADALGLDVVIDDRPENCLDVVSDSRARAILVWPSGTTDVPASARRVQIGVVSGINACLDLLADATRPDVPGTGLMARVRHLLGLS